MMKTIKRLPIALIAFALQTGAAFSDDTFDAPEGCEIFLTVVSEDCSTSILWQCDLAPAGDKWEAYFENEGLASISSYSGQYAWLDSQFLWDNSFEEAVGTPADPISLAMLQLNGTDSYAFDLRRTDDTGTRILHVEGEDYITSPDVTIDGVDLQTVHFNVMITEEDGSVFHQAEGEQLFSPEYGIFTSFRTVVTDGETVTEYHAAPVAFIEPGEQGFGNPTPYYGCEGDGSVPVIQEENPITNNPTKLGGGNK